MIDHPLSRFTHVDSPPAAGSPLAIIYDAFDARLLNAGIPTGMRNPPVIDVPITVTARLNGRLASNHDKLTDWLPKYERSFVDHATRQGPPRNVYLFSRAKGTGKTTTACRLAIDYMAAKFIGELRVGRTPAQRIAYMIDVNDFQQRYNISSMTHDEDGLQSIATEMKRAQHADMTVLDDLAIRSASDSFRQIIHAIINYRVVNGKVTIYTSNIPIDELVNIFDERLSDRVRENCFEVTFESDESKRGIRS